SWRKTYFEWMRNIRDWCISRQLWWGHRIPAWYCGDCSRTIVAREDPAACDACASRTLTQDPDVLDTWFSSSLWAFSTLGWPESTLELKRYYPTTVLVTGYDIIFFWVARMVMMGLKFMGDVPFPSVFFNGLVRDAKGEKMSKTRGNVVDLFELIDTYGTDAVRFTYAAMSSPGADVSLAPGRLEGSRAFANKIWNAVRYARPHLEAGPIGGIPDREALSVADRWILSRSSRLAGQVRESLEAFRFDEAAARIYQFAWHELCDWYLEWSKQDLASGGPAAGAPRAVLSHVLDRLLRLLHPMMPFLTEELWQALPGRAGALRPVSIAVAPFPDREPEWEDDQAEAPLEIIIEITVAVRNLKAQAGLPIKSGPIFIRPLSPEADKVLSPHESQIAGLTRSASVKTVAHFDPDMAAIRGVTSSAEYRIPLEGIDLGAERSRLSREIDRLAAELAGHRAKLDNEQFVSRARPEAIEKVRGAHAEISDRLARLKSTLDQLGS
ncbi:MAG TPA: class I tRNA ligase family protein, partial [Candidatus Polarisedimenticolia bacterium]|nr:class I tRNA ligase family protein [Candidatus Polarisedimenticolia bacterium]